MDKENKGKEIQMGIALTLKTRPATPPLSILRHGSPAQICLYRPHYSQVKLEHEEQASRVRAYPWQSGGDLSRRGCPEESRSGLKVLFAEWICNNSWFSSRS